MRVALMAVVLLLFALPTVAHAQQENQFPDYTDTERWDRASRLGVVSMAAAIRHAKDMDQPLDDFGRWWVDLFDDGWGEAGSYGPVQVMRGMRRNWLSFHGGEVEILESSDDEVTASFNRVYLDIFGSDRTLYGVSVEEYERVFSLFNQGIADYHGLQYDDRIEGQDWIVTFRR
jgi:hypothetical protein